MPDLVSRRIANETINVRGQKSYDVDARGICRDVSEEHAACLLQNPNWRRLPDGPPAQAAPAPEDKPDESDTAVDLPEAAETENTSSTEDTEE